MSPELQPDMRQDTWDPSAVQIGWASVDMTPPLDPPVRMRGGVDATGVMDPITATALAIDSPAHPDEAVILISVDLLWVPDGNRNKPDLLGEVRASISQHNPNISPDNVILMATHTHVAPTITEANKVFYAEKIAQAATLAWENKIPSAVSYGLGHAVAGHNRIVTHHDGTSRMVGSLQQGKISHPDFSHIEGFEDHTVHLLYTFDAREQLTGVVVNISCPSQVQRGDELSADFWHEVRQELDARLGRAIHLLPQVSASGDVATIVMVERKGEDRMARLRYPELTDARALRRRQIAHRVVEAILNVLPYMDDVMEQTPHLDHEIKRVDLPGGGDCATPTGESYPVELHGLRISEISMITSPFELYLDYGTRIKGRSPATQTFVVELAGSGSYLPTRRAIAGGGYGARDSECYVGANGGNLLVEESIELLERMWGE